jgi:hypothetical protein
VTSMTVILPCRRYYSVADRLEQLCRWSTLLRVAVKCTPNGTDAVRAAGARACTAGSNACTKAYSVTRLTFYTKEQLGLVGSVMHWALSCMPPSRTCLLGPVTGAACNRRVPAAQMEQTYVFGMLARVRFGVCEQQCQAAAWLWRPEGTVLICLSQLK